MITHAGSTLLTTAIAAMLARRPYVYRNISDPQHWGQVRAADLRIGLPLRHCAHVVALYGAAGRFLTAQYGLRPERVTVISNAVDAERFERRDESAKGAARAAYELNDDPVVGFLGALVPEKRPEVAVEIVAAMPSVTLLLAGDGPLRDDVMKRIAALGIEDRVRLLGPLSDPAPLLAAVDLLLAPSSTEGVPGVILEAAMIGVPIVATDVGGVGELIRDMGVGVAAPVDDLTALTDGVFAVLADPEGHVAPRSTLEPRFDVRSVADAWLGVLESVTPRRRSGRSERAARSTSGA